MKEIEFSDAEKFQMEFIDKKAVLVVSRMLCLAMFCIAAHRLDMKQWLEAALIFSFNLLALYLMNQDFGPAAIAWLGLFGYEHWTLKQRVQSYNDELEMKLREKWGLE